MKKAPTTPEQFRMLLREAGYKATPSRLHVLSALRKAKRPLSPQALISHLTPQYDQATIYRIVKALKKSALIRQVDLRHNHPHYELADPHDHHHIICLSCGLVEDMSGCNMDTVKHTLLQQTKHFSEIKEHALEFYGICKKCVKKSITHI